MKIFLTKLILFSLISCSTIFLIYSFPSKEKDYYLASIKLKQDRLQKLSSPKIILIGGSNLVFGIDSELIEEKTNYSVVNMGLHEIISLDFPINQIISSISKDDLILVTPEYSTYFSPNSNPNLTTFHRIFSVYPKGIKYVNYNQNKIKIFSDHLRFKLKDNINKHILRKQYKTLKQNDAYHLNGINKYGDMTNHLELRSKYGGMGRGVSHFKEKQIPSSFFTLLKKLGNVCQSKQAKYYISYPSLCNSQSDIETLNKIEHQLKSNNIPTLGRPIDFTFDKKYFFDTQYHLNQEGRNLRSELLIDLINHL